jgi:hypothetical protein
MRPDRVLLRQICHFAFDQEFIPSRQRSEA